MERPTETYTDNFGQTIEFSVPEPHKKICINISGGADSAILLWMLIQYCEKHIPEAEIYVITSANPIKGWYNADWSTKVLNKVLQITGTTLIKNHYTFYSTDQIRSEITEAENLQKDLYGITFILHGTTQNPSLEDRDTFSLESYKPRDPGHGRPIMCNNTGTTTWVPFINVDKRMVAHLYKHFDLTDILFTHTRSCEWHEGLEVNEKLVPNPEDEHCGECWWCQERKWAFGQL